MIIKKMKLWYLLLSIGITNTYVQKVDRNFFSRPAADIIKKKQAPAK